MSCRVGGCGQLHAQRTKTNWLHLSSVTADNARVALRSLMNDSSCTDMKRRTSQVHVNTEDFWDWTDRGSEVSVGQKAVWDWTVPVYVYVLWVSCISDAASENMKSLIFGFQGWAAIMFKQPTQVNKSILQCK